MGGALAIFMLLILLIVAFFAWAALRGWLRGSVQAHDERTRDAMMATMNSLDAGQIENPSWANDPDKMQAFTYVIRKLIDRASISEETRKTLFAEEATQQSLMTHAAHMEHSGATFIQQQHGAGEFAIQMAQEFERRKSNDNPISFAAETEAARKKAEVDEALRISIKTFLEMYDQLEEQRRGYYAAAVHILYQGLIDGFGSLDGFMEASDDLQLRFVAKLKTTDEHANRHTEDVAFVYKLSRQFMSSILFLMREERNVYFEKTTLSPELTYGIRRLIEIVKEGEAKMS